MTFRVDLTLDTRDAESLAPFWKLALGYEDEPPPAPFTTRDEWVASFGSSADDPDEGGGAWLHDPAGVGPRLSLLDVPEPKTAKNRLHMDIRVGSWAGIEARAAELVTAGGRILNVVDGHHIVMADPEDNEFCLGA
ncbi:VOC family protein [Actinoplanes sp. LDG1-06]|uniref:VOC family protein n=1 Tax=Paractinoplanes ovalisporus TaxID=2810368 RepID=A0ABS2ACP3_9ACTN|nr:VOC family protein [Actinoplanes ovalisporus]MBM2617592.1 VOC family protein [Actinoplanes ovalisporus]